MKTPKLNFKRLVSNLPYNPSLINQVAFYSKRLRQESSIRRLGFLFFALAFAVQIFAVAAPPKPSLASAGNDIKPGGFSSQSEGVQACRDNMNNFGAVIGALGVSCDDLANGTARRIDYNEQGGQLYSIGYTQYGFANEQAVDLTSLAVRVYARPLQSWGAHCWNDGKNCMAITGTTKNGMFFMVLFSCGNLVTIGVPHPTPPPPPPPPPTPQKAIFCSVLNMSVANGAHIPMHTSINVTGQATGNNLPAGELVDMYYDYYNADSKIPSPLQTAQGIPFVGSVATDGTPRTFTMDTPGHYIFRLTVKYDGSTKAANGNATGNCVKDIYVDNEVCKNPNDTEHCNVRNKRARNVTRNIDNANGTVAQAGDVIEYTLSVTNTLQFTTTKNYVIKDQISDILEYADVVDLGGGKLDSQNYIVWPAVNIKPNQTVTKKFTVKVKNPIPQTPASVSNPGSFDLTMTNVYGDTINIKLPGSTPKIVEQTSNSLPNTGPGENIAISFVVCAVIGYFFARSRLLNKELDLVREEYTTGA